MPCWIAPRDIEPGEAYAGAILDGLDQAPAIVLIFSSAANSSPHVSREVETAVSGGRPIIPIQHEAVEPSRSLRYFIGTAQWLDTVGVPEQTWVPRLVHAVRRAIGGQPIIEPPPGRTIGQAPPPAEGAASGRASKEPAGPRPDSVGEKHRHRPGPRAAIAATVAVVAAVGAAVWVLSDAVGPDGTGRAVDRPTPSGESTPESGAGGTTSEENGDPRPVACWDGTTAASTRGCPVPQGREGMATVFPALDDSCSPVGSPVQGKVEVYECGYDGYLVRYTRWLKGYDKYAYYDIENQSDGSPWQLDGEQAGQQWFSVESDATEGQPYQWSAAFRHHPFSVSVEGATSADRSAGVAALDVAPPSRIGLG